ncbi:hypothetical protein SAMN04488564_101339 [Lentzea waywayandensis]|uniref:Histidine kinase-, DNA gyrase B-, and HSP90-like ATPase n=1 Tax=Lentzea waywayandensis TaxID=84724 RepID=A0A1I6CUE8_9PSEU|nr:hypothetical protein [Lentzea waywayandensis]SFQ96850.1 hypothetical protein SAMN04488564_101339 [Lentzea waywayandensis]
MPESTDVISIEVLLPLTLLSDLTTSHEWSKYAAQHVGWQGVRDDATKSATVAVVRRLAGIWETRRRSLADDPWLDVEFGTRFTDAVRWLVSLVRKHENVELSDAEVALLVTFPYLHQAFWAKQAADVLHGISPATAAFTQNHELPAFHAFAARHGILHRRGADAGDSAANSIAWWLFHHWLVGESDCYLADGLTSLLPSRLPVPLRWVLTPKRLMELLRVVQIDPAFIEDPDRENGLKPIAHIAGGSDQEQKVREQLIGYLLVIAYRTAIDSALTHRVIADHLGIEDGVTPEGVLSALRDAQWLGERTRVLTTSCDHDATVLALRRHTAALDAVLTDVARASETPGPLLALNAVPVHVSADGIELRTAQGSNKAPISLGHQFRLASDRIQELLMGEQLYGTPELAIRELYQNALDACRYREARTIYLRKTGGKVQPWSGRIDFRQGVDERGRPYLECVDNGIGMRDRELVQVFSRAGVRFSDLPEYVEEQADWASQGIESYPNSRFGIGVLSYFMLADEITVTTCRLSRAGTPEQRLEVHIAGPGALFKVRDLGKGEEAGTVVRLWLRRTGDPPRCTELLRRILWISDYEVTSDDMSGLQRWEPGELSPAAPVGTDPFEADESAETAGQVLPAPGGRVWWCETTGAILADGIWAGTSVFGAVVNLTGRDLPQLTVDRKTIIGLNHPLVEELMRAGREVLLDGPRSPLSHGWLSKLVKDMPRLADEICELAIAARYRPWTIAGNDMPIEVVGCFPTDTDMLSGQRFKQPRWDGRTGRWRLAAWRWASTGAGCAGGSGAVVPALPSDDMLLSSDREHDQWLSDTMQPELGHILSAARRAQRSPREVAERLTTLGWSTPDPETLPPDARAADPQLLSRHRDGEWPWLSRKQPVPHEHVLLAAVGTGLTPATVLERLSELGYSAAPADRFPEVVHPTDKTLLHGGLGYCMLSHPSAVPASHVLAAAATTGWTPAAVARRLTELGYSTPTTAQLPSDSDRHDNIIFTTHFGMRVESPVPLWQVTAAAIKSGRSPAQVAARFAEADLDVPVADDLPELKLPLDVLLTRVQHVDNSRPDEPLHDASVEIGHVLSVAIKTGLTPSQAARRLTELGHTPPEELPDTAEPDDLVLVSTTIGTASRPSYSHSPWLRAGTQVHLPRILIAAAKTRRSPRDVAHRFMQLGFSTPPEPLLGFGPRPDDLLLLSAALDGKAPWLDGDHTAMVRHGFTLPLGHVLVAAARLGLPASDILARLELLGLRTEAADLPAGVDALADPLLNRAVDVSRWSIYNQDQFQWLSATVPVETRHLLIAAARTGLPLTNILRRLADMGFPVEDAQRLPHAVDHTDLRLLSRDGNGQEPFRSLAEEFPLGRVPLAAAQAGTSPDEAIARLQRLGFTIGS